MVWNAHHKPERSGMLLLVSRWKNSKKWKSDFFRGISALNRGFLKRKGGRCPIHFNAESSSAELLFRTIHSANQLSFYGAAASWCEDLAQLIPGQTHVFMETSVAKANGQLTQKLEPQEGDSLVHTPRRNDEAAGNRLRMYLQNFEEFSYEGQFTKASGSVGFMRRVAVDVYDGFEGKTGACREYTKPREDPGSEIIAWISGQTRIRSHLQVKTTCCLDILNRKNTVNIRRRIYILGN